jgi:hypothetical protein
MTIEWLWGQKRIQAELARLGFAVSARTARTARTVAKYMNSRHNRSPSPGWRQFLKRYDSKHLGIDFLTRGTDTRMRSIWRGASILFARSTTPSRRYAFGQVR